MMYFLILLCGCYIVVAEYSFNFVRNDTLDDYVCNDQYRVFRFTVSSKIACVAECSREANCSSIFYEPVSKECTGCLSTFDGTLQSYPGSLHYTAACPEGFVLFRRYCYGLTGYNPYDVDKAECQTLGAEPAEIADFEENQFLKTWLLEAACPEGFVLFRRYCYGLTGYNPYDVDKAECQTLGAEPAEIADFEENQFLKTWLLEEYDYVFIGLTDIASEGNWVWESSRSLTFSDMSPGFPNSNSTNCAVFYHDYSDYNYYYDIRYFRWIPHYCDHGHKMLCKMEIR